MSKMKANPLGNLEMEIVHTDLVQGGGITDSRVADQAPEHSSMTGNETFAIDAFKSEPYADIIKQKGGLSGADVAGGADMGKES
jgi:hypothetical protein